MSLDYYPDLKKFDQVSGEETTVKQHTRQKHMLCFSCLSQVELVEGETSWGQMIGSKFKNGNPAFILTTVYEGFCRECQREYEIIVRSEY